MCPFPPSLDYVYILVAVDYVSKWIAAIPCGKIDHKTVLKFLKENVLSRNDAYENSQIYKERTKLFSEKNILRKIFEPS
ncbi:hypothetical protein L3X38_045363 [Prunus dulcis]|uniref:Integrase catalytic domain-containing protein n=1 Tax=Prunus dulcis TaxID=3755 RepID=A0AAD4V2J0_PRUDU|nr:hypothetical protein L3X38_045363 [Prunus dulcis]